MQVGFFLIVNYVLAQKKLIAVAKLSNTETIIASLMNFTAKLVQRIMFCIIIWVFLKEISLHYHIVQMKICFLLRLTIISAIKVDVLKAMAIAKASLSSIKASNGKLFCVAAAYTRGRFKNSDAAE